MQTNPHAGQDAGRVADEIALPEPGAPHAEGRGLVRAAIDVGTNSVKLLVGRVNGAEVIPISEESKQTRLGAGFYQTRQLQPEPIEATAQAVRAFAAKARRMGALSIRLMGTSAARDALNAGELVRAIREKSGLTLDQAKAQPAEQARISAEIRLLADFLQGSTRGIVR